MTRASKLRACAVAFALTALLALAAAGCSKTETAAEQCKKTCAPNAIESVSDDFLLGTRCSCQPRVECDDTGDDGGAK